MVLSSYSTTLLLYYSTTPLLNYSTTVPLYHCTTLLLCYTTTLLLHYSTTLLLYYSTTLPPFFLLQCFSLAVKAELCCYYLKYSFDNSRSIKLKFICHNDKCHHDFYQDILQTDFSVPSNVNKVIVKESVNPHSSRMRAAVQTCHV